MRAPRWSQRRVHPDATRIHTAARVGGARAGGAGVVVLALTALAACATGPGSAGSAGPSPALPRSSEPVHLSPADFSTRIDNRYWPMKPGTRWSYEEASADGSVQQGEVTVTSATKKVASGITGRVVRDTLWRDGAIVEDTFDWYAQHQDGTIWY